MCYSGSNANGMSLVRNVRKLMEQNTKFVKECLFPIEGEGSNFGRVPCIETILYSTPKSTELRLSKINLIFSCLFSDL